MQFFAVLIVAAPFVRYFWLLAAGAVAISAVIQARKAWRRYQADVAAEEQRLDEDRARADRLHAWVLAGDPPGTYGENLAVRM